MGFHGIYGIQEIFRDFKVWRYFKGFKGISRDLNGFQEILMDFTEFQRISLDNMGFHGIFKEFHSEVCLVMRLAVPRSSLDLYCQISCVHQIPQLELSQRCVFCSSVCTTSCSLCHKYFHWYGVHGLCLANFLYQRTLPRQILGRCLNIPLIWMKTVKLISI